MTTTTGLAQLTGDYTIDPARTRIGFVVRQYLFAKVRGRFGEVEGTARLDGDDPSRSEVRLSIVAASIDTGNKRRDNHLRGAFLDVTSHPVMTFVSTAIERTGDAAFAVTGDLTIRGTTRAVTIGLGLTETEAGPVFTGTTVVDRNDWGVHWNAVFEGGGVFVGEQATLELEIALAGVNR